jgi:hypothetical protein
VRRIESRNRLIQQKTFGALRHKQGKPDTLAFTAGRGVVQTIRERLEGGSTSLLLRIILIDPPESTKHTVPRIAPERDQFPNQHARSEWDLLIDGLISGQSVEIGRCFARLQLPLPDPNI